MPLCSLSTAALIQVEGLYELTGIDPPKTTTCYCEAWDLRRLVPTPGSVKRTLTSVGKRHVKLASILDRFRSSAACMLIAMIESFSD